MEILTYECHPFNISNNYIVAPYIVVIPDNAVFKKIDEIKLFNDAVSKQFIPLFVSRYVKSYRLFKDNYLDNIYEHITKNNTDIDSIVIMFVKLHSKSIKPFVIEIDCTKNHEEILKDEVIFKMFSDIYENQYRNIDIFNLDVKSFIEDGIKLYFRFSNNDKIEASYEKLKETFGYIL